MFEAEQQLLQEKINAYFSDQNIPTLPEFPWMPVPFAGEWGISLPLFHFASQEAKQSGQRINIQARAQQLAEGIAAYLGTTPGIQHIEAVKGYLNLYYSTPEYSQKVIDQVLEQGVSFGCGRPKDEQIMVEFSQPNTHKAFHVGHLRSAILGDTLCRILETAGYAVVRANYIGDIGLHVIKWLWNYMNFHSGEEPGEDITRWMGELYAEANRRLEDHPEYEADVRALYSRWDQRDPVVVDLWKKTRQWSFEGFDKIYAKLDIHFDRVYSNSEAEFPGKAMVQELIEAGIAQDERPEGPVIVKIDEQLGLKKEKYRVLVILRSDSTALYSTEDLALAKIKFSDYPDLERSLYVVDVRQSLHFQQVFKTLELAGYPWAGGCQHIPYEIVNLPGNVVIASREGTVVLLEDLIREATTRARAVVEDKNPTLSEDQKQEIAVSVGLAALKYPMLARENNRIVTFDWEAALDFNGQAAPYIQYAQVRANSILRKLEGKLPASRPPEHTLEPAEIELIDRISRLPDEIQRAASELKPLVIANIAYELARAFTDFYMQCPVLKAEEDVRNFRLRLVAAARHTMVNALDLLGIRSPEVM
ncbi:MAG: arginine--tRNA ligase [Anaerolineales bacterium]